MLWLVKLSKGKVCLLHCLFVFGMLGDQQIGDKLKYIHIFLLPLCVLGGWGWGGSVAQSVQPKLDWIGESVSTR